MSNLQGVWSLVSQYQAIGNSNWADPLVGDVGLFARSATSTAIDFVNIASDGNAADFGDHSNDQGNTQVAGSNTRAIFRIEYISSAGDTIEFCEIARKSNTTDFGDVSVARYSGTAVLSNQTRAVFAGGYLADNSGYSNIMDYVTIATTGDATDFGDLTVARDSLGSLSSTTRGVFSMGRSSGGDFSSNVMDYITIGSTGNAIDFGDLSVVRTQSDGASSNTRGLFMGGYNTSQSSTSNRYNTIDYITIASTGNASDFGDLSSQGTGGSTSNGTKAVFNFGVEHGFSGNTGNTNTIDKVTIASTGNATDFGDASTNDGNTVKATSDSHGGL
jgi:hypothetical protein